METKRSLLLFIFGYETITERISGTAYLFTAKIPNQLYTNIIYRIEIQCGNTFFFLFIWVFYTI